MARFNQRLINKYFRKLSIFILSCRVDRFFQKIKFNIFHIIHNLLNNKWPNKNARSHNILNRNTKNNKKIKIIAVISYLEEHFCTGSLNNFVANWRWKN